MNKRNYLTQKITFVLLPILIVSQSINNFDVEPDPGYWGFEKMADIVPTNYKLASDN